MVAELEPGMLTCRDTDCIGLYYNTLNHFNCELIYLNKANSLSILPVPLYQICTTLITSSIEELMKIAGARNSTDQIPFQPTVSKY